MNHATRECSIKHIHNNNSDVKAKSNFNKFM